MIAKTTRPHLLTREAAAARIEALEAALEPMDRALTRAWTHWIGQLPSDKFDIGFGITLGDLKKARAALASEQDK